MAKTDEGYEIVEVDSFVADRTSGLHGRMHLRPTPGGRHPTSLRVEHPKKKTDPGVHPIGTRFHIRAKLTDREGEGEFL